MRNESRKLDLFLDENKDYRFPNNNSRGKNDDNQWKWNLSSPTANNRQQPSQNPQLPRERYSNLNKNSASGGHRYNPEDRDHFRSSNKYEALQRAASYKNSVENDEMHRKNYRNLIQDSWGDAVNIINEKPTHIGRTPLELGYLKHKNGEVISSGSEPKNTFWAYEPAHSIESARQLEARAYKPYYHYPRNNETIHPSYAIQNNYKNIIANFDDIGKSLQKPKPDFMQLLRLKMSYGDPELQLQREKLYRSPSSNLRIWS